MVNPPDTILNGVGCEGAIENIKGSDTTMHLFMYGVVTLRLRYWVTTPDYTHLYMVPVYQEPTPDFQPTITVYV